MDLYTTGSLLLDRYEVVSGPLKGGMGAVYFCFDKKNGRPIALKTFQPNFLSDPKKRERFLHECQTWLNLGKHLNIVRCYHIERSVDGMQIYLVLELIAKEQGREDASLRSWLLPSQPLSMELSLLFAIQIVNGLKYAISVISGFVHRDLKPENILVGADKIPGLRVNRVRVTDFGLARTNLLQEADSSVTFSSTDARLLSSFSSDLGGTPLYMAPELWLGAVASVQSDIFSFGCILFEMLCGHKVLSKESLQLLNQALSNAPITPIPNELPSSVQKILTQCLYREPSLRYKTWLTLHKELCAAYQELFGCLPVLEEERQAFEQLERIENAWSLNMLGISYIDLGKPEYAIPFLEEALTISRIENNLDLELGSLSNLGPAQMLLGRLADSIKTLQMAVDVARRGNFLKGEGAALGNLGIALLDSGDVKKAIECQLRDLEICRALHDLQGEGITLGNLGIDYLYAGEPHKAIECQEHALKIAQETRDVPSEIRAIGNLANAYSAIGNFKQAIEYEKSALELAEAIGRVTSQASSASGLGASYAKMGQYEKAVEYYKKFYTLAKEIKDQTAITLALCDLGATYSDMQDFQSSLYYYEQALRICQANGDRVNEARALGGLGLANLQLGNTERSIQFLHQSLRLTRETGNRKEEAHTLNILGVAFSYMGNFVVARNALSDSIKINKAIDNLLGAAVTSFNLGIIYYNVKQFKEALECATYSLEIWKQNGLKDFVEKAQMFIQAVSREVR